MLRQFMQIQVEQNELALEIGAKQALLFYVKLLLDGGLHHRDGHNRYFDPTLTSKDIRRTEMELAELEQQFEENQAKLKALGEKLVPA